MASRSTYSPGSTHSSGSTHSPGSRYRRKIKLSPKTTGQRLNRALHAFHRLYQSQLFWWFFQHRVTKTLLFCGYDQNAQINLITCRNSELMAGSQYPQTTRSLLKSGLLLFIKLFMFLFRRKKSSSPSKID